MKSISQVVRRSSSIALAVSFLALLVSGSVMMFADGLAPRLRMHPVHNVFGLVMIAAGLVHVAFNARALCGYLRSRWAAVLGVALAAILALLFVAGLHRPLDTDALRQVEAILDEGHDRR
jgi:hypothetical protein